MEKTQCEWAGRGFGHHASYTFYKGVKYLSKDKKGDDKWRVLSLGQFFFVRVWSESDTVSVAEMQLLWEDKTTNQMMSSIRLYFLPECTNEGRLSQHGQDELIAVAEKSVLRVKDLLQWLVPSGELSWERGARGVASVDCSTEEDISRQPSSLHTKRLDLTEVEKIRTEIGDDDPDEHGVVIVSAPTYYRYRSILKRLEGVEDKWMKNSLVMALGGFATKTRNTAVMFAKEIFDYPELEEHPMLCNHLAPKLKGRPRKKKRGGKETDPSSPSGSDSNGSEQQQQQNNNKLVGVPKPGSRKDLLKILSQKGSKEELEFLRKLIRFMERRNTPIERPPMLGFKQIDLHQFFAKVKELGGHGGAVAKKAWKLVYDDLGGNPQNTSAATCTRRHYERFLLPYEKHLKKINQYVIPAKAGKDTEKATNKNNNNTTTSSSANSTKQPQDQAVNGGAKPSRLPGRPKRKKRKTHNSCLDETEGHLVVTELEDLEEEMDEEEEVEEDEEEDQDDEVVITGEQINNKAAANLSSPAMGKIGLDATTTKTPALNQPQLEKDKLMAAIPTVTATTGTAATTLAGISIVSTSGGVNNVVGSASAAGSSLPPLTITNSLPPNAGGMFLPTVPVSNMLPPGLSGLLKAPINPPAGGNVPASGAANAASPYLGIKPLQFLMTDPASALAAAASNSPLPSNLLPLPQGLPLSIPPVTSGTMTDSKAPISAGQQPPLKLEDLISLPGGLMLAAGLPPGTAANQLELLSDPAALMAAAAAAVSSGGDAAASGSALQNLAKIASRYSGGASGKDKSRNDDFAGPPAPKKQKTEVGISPLLGQPLPPSSTPGPSSGRKSATPASSASALLTGLGLPGALGSNSSSPGDMSKQASALLQQFSMLSPGILGAPAGGGSSNNSAATNAALSAALTAAMTGWPGASGMGLALDPSKMGPDGQNLLKYYEQQFKALAAINAGGSSGSILSPVGSPASSASSTAGNRQNGVKDQSKKSGGGSDAASGLSSSSKANREKLKISKMPPADQKRPPQLLQTPCAFLQTSNIYGNPHSELAKAKDSVAKNIAAQSLAASNRVPPPSQLASGEVAYTIPVNYSQVLDLSLSSTNGGSVDKTLNNASTATITIPGTNVTLPLSAAAGPLAQLTSTAAVSALAGRRVIVDNNGVVLLGDDGVSVTPTGPGGATGAASPAALRLSAPLPPLSQSTTAGLPSAIIASAAGTSLPPSLEVSVIDRANPVSSQQQLAAKLQSPFSAEALISSRPLTSTTSAGGGIVMTPSGSITITATHPAATSLALPTAMSSATTSTTSSLTITSTTTWQTATGTKPAAPVPPQVRSTNSSSTSSAAVPPAATLALPPQAAAALLSLPGAQLLPENVLASLLPGMTNPAQMSVLAAIPPSNPVVATSSASLTGPGGNPATAVLPSLAGIQFAGGAVGSASGTPQNSAANSNAAAAAYLQALMSGASPSAAAAALAAASGLQQLPPTSGTKPGGVSLAGNTAVAAPPVSSAAILSNLPPGLASMDPMSQYYAAIAYSQQLQSAYNNAAMGPYAAFAAAAAASSATTTTTSTNSNNSMAATLPPGLLPNIPASLASAMGLVPGPGIGSPAANSSPGGLSIRPTTYSTSSGGGPGASAIPSTGLPFNLGGNSGVSLPTPANVAVGSAAELQALQTVYKEMMSRAGMALPTAAAVQPAAPTLSANNGAATSSANHNSAAAAAAMAANQYAALLSAGLMGGYAGLGGPAGMPAGLFSMNPNMADSGRK